MLQPMHSRISSSRPSSILRGRNGSAIDGRAAPIRSHAPLRMIAAIRSGSVSRPTPTIGLAVASPHTARCSRAASPPRRTGTARSPCATRQIEPTLTSHRSTRWSARRTNSRPSSRSTPSAPQPVDGDPAGDRAVVADRLAHRLQRLQPDPRPVGQRAAVLVGAAVVVRRQELAEQVGVAAVDVDDVEAGVARAARPPRPVVLTSRRMSRFVIALGTTPVAKSLAICDGAADGSRDSEFSACTPRVPRARCPPARPARAPRRTSAPSIRRSWSSQIRAEMYGVSSDSGVDGAYSVQTAAQPPSALTARCRACDHGFSTPNRCSGAPGRSGCAASWARSGPARRGCRGADRGPSAGAVDSTEPALAHVSSWCDPPAPDLRSALVLRCPPRRRAAVPSRRPGAPCPGKPDVLCGSLRVPLYRGLPDGGGRRSPCASSPPPHRHLEAGAGAGAGHRGRARAAVHPRPRGCTASCSARWPSATT